MSNEKKCPNCDGKLGIFKIGIMYYHDGKRFCSLKCKKEYKNGTHHETNSSVNKIKKVWYKRWWAITLWIILGLGIIGSFMDDSTTNQNINTLSQPIEEISIKEIVDGFSDLTELQQKEMNKKLKGMRVQTTIYVSRVDKASLSSQYVVLQMYDYPYNLIPYVKAFFPAEEKNNLLSLTVGDTLIFSGEFVSYKEGYMTTTVEFTKSKFIGVK